MAFWLVKWDAVLIKLHFYVRQMEITYSMLAGTSHLAIMPFSNGKWEEAFSQCGEKKCTREIRNRSITDWSIHTMVWIKIHIDGGTKAATETALKYTKKWKWFVDFQFGFIIAYPQYAAMVIEHVQKTFFGIFRCVQMGNLIRMAKQSELMKCGSCESRFVKVFLLNLYRQVGE